MSNIKIGDKLELIKTDKVKANYSTMSLRAEYAIVVEIQEANERYKVNLVYDDSKVDIGYLWNFNDVRLFKTSNKVLNYNHY